MNYNEFRNAVLDEQDRAFEEHGGAVPDHIVLSKEVYDWLDEGNRFEELRDNADPQRPGYLGMRVWWSRCLDERDNVALCISDSVFDKIAPKAKDF